MRLSSSAGYALAVFALGTLLFGCNIGGSTTADPSLKVPSGAKTSANPNVVYYPAEIWNGFVTIPTTGPPPTDFEIIFAGNVTADIPNPPEPGFGVYDPFCAPSQTCNNIKVSYSASSNTTTVDFFGPTLYPNVPGNPTEVHFGLLNGPGGVRVKCFKFITEWTFASSPPVAVPILNVCGHRRKQKPDEYATGKTVYATVFVETSFSPITPSSPATSGGWYDVAYTKLSGRRQPKFGFTNGGTQTLYTAESGIVLNEALPNDPTCKKELACKGNIAALELLNFADMPPPGSPSSPFIPMTNPPPSKLAPGL